LKINGRYVIYFMKNSHQSAASKEEHAQNLQWLRSVLDEDQRMRFGYSANVGEHGGFVTEYFDVYVTVQKSLGKHNA